MRQTKQSLADFFDAFEDDYSTPYRSPKQRLDDIKRGYKEELAEGFKFSGPIDNLSILIH